MPRKVFTEIRTGRCYLEPLGGRTSPCLPLDNYRGIDIPSLPPLEGDIDYLRNRMGFVMPDSHSVLSNYQWGLRQTKETNTLGRSALKRRMLIQKILQEEESRDQLTCLKDLKRRGRNESYSTSSKCKTDYGLEELSDTRSLQSSNTISFDSSSVFLSMASERRKRREGSSTQSVNSRNNVLGSVKFGDLPR